MHNISACFLPKFWRQNVPITTTDLLLDQVQLSHRLLLFFVVVECVVVSVFVVIVVVSVVIVTITSLVKIGSVLAEIYLLLVLLYLYLLLLLMAILLFLLLFYPRNLSLIKVWSKSGH